MDNEMKNETLSVEKNEPTEILKQTKMEILWEIFRFLLVGGGATIFDYATHPIVKYIVLSFTGASEQVAIWIATASGFLVGMIINWVLSVLFVFRAVRNKKEATSKKSFAIFVLICVIGLLITLVGVWLLKMYIIPEFELFGVKTFLNLTWNEWIAKMIMTCIVLVWNYIGRKIFVFKS